MSLVFLSVLLIVEYPESKESLGYSRHSIHTCWISEQIRVDYRVFAKTHHGSLLQQGLNRTWHLIPIPAPHPYPSFPHLLTVPLDGPKAPATAPAPRSHHSSAAHHDHHVHLTGVPELPPGLRSHHQPGALCFLHLPTYLSMSYYFDRNDVALKNFA